MQTPVRKLSRRKIAGCSFFGDDAESKVWMQVKMLDTARDCGPFLCVIPKRLDFAA
jgi:hypothetical protein